MNRLIETHTFCRLDSTFLPLEAMKSVFSKISIVTSLIPSPLHPISPISLAGTTSLTHSLPLRVKNQSEVYNPLRPYPLLFLADSIIS